TSSPPLSVLLFLCYVRALRMCVFSFCVCHAHSPAFDNIAFHAVTLMTTVIHLFSFEHFVGCFLRLLFKANVSYHCYCEGILSCLWCFFAKAVCASLTFVTCVF